MLDLLAIQFSEHEPTGQLVNVKKHSVYTFFDTFADHWLDNELSVMALDNGKLVGTFTSDDGFRFHEMGFFQLMGVLWTVNKLNGKTNNEMAGMMQLIDDIRVPLDKECLDISKNEKRK
jgi:hypothetical protein